MFPGFISSPSIRFQSRLLWFVLRPVRRLDRPPLPTDLIPAKQGFSNGQTGGIESAIKTIQSST
jgi:hypothetical protein